MKNIRSIQLKAAFLMVIFSLNIIVGFACAMGLDMGFNSHHHDEEATIADNHSHKHYKSHHHDEADSRNSSKEGKDNCCNDKVTKFAQLDKSVPQGYSADINPAFFTSFVSVFYQTNIFSLYSKDTSIKYFVRSSPPTIPDIRIAIQSFLI
ncbi:hypothetical protein FRZ67_21345 [Panacibacter ginsenosidivorans]|uniref:Uncharacterized protein n=1 Tax=Panacibacter ginsenosidivorans TaxID=1813871 RepID=A0A5B8VEL1_9BACT|nr:hypothetical protein [Panacibacter ginsenosidivorans]QEC69719.1 hypothetical protein FRZ67_21345 [Panacibacter ginsenosidivorans]